MEIDKINKQLPPFFELRIEDGNLELYTVVKSDIVNVVGQGTRQMKRYKTICPKADAEKVMIGMQVIMSMFYTLSKVDEKEN